MLSLANRQNLLTALSPRRFSKLISASALLFVFSLAIGSTPADALPVPTHDYSMSEHAAMHTEQGALANDISCATACQQAASTAPQPAAINEVVRKKIKQPRPVIPPRLEQPQVRQPKLTARVYLPVTREVYKYTCAFLS